MEFVPGQLLMADQGKDLYLVPVLVELHIRSNLGEKPLALDRVVAGCLSWEPSVYLCRVTGFMQRGLWSTRSDIAWNCA
jgi:hypothetical protein